MSENNENIPLDEMMRNLKKDSVQKRHSRAEGGERVVRADGSEAIKVKSKKRRTVQPKKEKEKKLTKLKVILIASAIGLLLLSVIGYSVLLGYYNGNRFKSKISETIVNVSGAEVELGNVDVSSASAKISQIDLKWSGENSLLKKLNLVDIHADFGVLAFIGGGWGGSAVGVNKAELELEMSKKNPTLNTKSERPVDFKFGLYQCSNLNVNFGEDSLWSFKNASVSYRVSDDSDDQFSLGSGDLTIPFFGEFTVKTGLVNCSASIAQVYLGMEAVGHKGIINLDGTTGYNEGSNVDFKTKLENYSLRDWVDPRARRFISGKIKYGEGTLKMKLGEIESFVTNTNFSTRVAVVKDFEFINTIAQLLEGDYYPSPRFTDESSMTMKRTKHRVEFTDIDLLQAEQMRIKGNFTIDEKNKISGSLKVGLPVMVLSSKHGKQIKEVFKDDDGEYVWVDVTLGGEASQPLDDLNEKFKEAAVKLGNQVPLFEQKFKELTE